MKRNQIAAAALMGLMLSVAGCPSSDSDEAHKASATAPAAKPADPGPQVVPPPAAPTEAAKPEAAAPGAAAPAAAAPAAAAAPGAAAAPAAK